MHSISSGIGGPDAAKAGEMVRGVVDATIVRRAAAMANGGARLGEEFVTGGRGGRRRWQWTSEFKKRLYDNSYAESGERKEDTKWQVCVLLPSFTED